MLCQVITAVLKDKGDKTKVRAVAAASSAPHDNAHSRSTQVSLIFANQTEDDILCRKVRDWTVSPARALLMPCMAQELEALAAENPNFKARAGGA